MSSNRLRVELEPAYVLHQFDYRDSSRIVEFLVRDHGRIAVVAKGVRRSSNRQRGLLRPFQPLLLSWSGRELGTLTGLEPAGPAQSLAGDALLAGFYANELCLKLMAAHDPHPEVFVAYASLVEDLSRNIVSPALRRFELELLDALGYGLNLTADIETGEVVDPAASYAFHVESGPERSRNTDPALAIPGSHLLAIARAELQDSDVLRSAQRILRAAIDRHLGGRTLKSREVLRELYARGGRKTGDSE